MFFFSLTIQFKAGKFQLKSSKKSKIEKIFEETIALRGFEPRSAGSRPAMRRPEDTESIFSLATTLQGYAKFGTM
ncbi:MAG: hypothetical protein DRO88_08045 [Promethearchaeia archaeon]|nr:MAG: hypothetical protein DRO88_08045 [Candidatus Lokiarchaeia archaeon]